MMQIIPAVLTKDIVQAQVLITDILNKKKVERIQIDFVDGKYNNNLTFRPSELDLMQYWPVKFDAHLMVIEDNALMWGKTAEKVGYDRVFVQVESVTDLRGYKCVAVDLDTEIKEEFVDGKEAVIVMAVKAGFGGQEFDPKVVEKIKGLRGLRDIRGGKFKICVDGGVEVKHLAMLEEAGADEVAVGGRRYLEEFGGLWRI